MLLISDLKSKLSILYNKLVTTIITNYLVLIQFSRIYSRKSIVRRLEIIKLILLVIAKIKIDENKKEIKIKIKIIKIKIIKRTIILTIKKLVRDVKNLEKNKIVIAKIAIETKIETTIIVKNVLYL